MSVDSEEPDFFGPLNDRAAEIDGAAGAESGEPPSVASPAPSVPLAVDPASSTAVQASPSDSRSADWLTAEQEAELAADRQIGLEAVEQLISIKRGVMVEANRAQRQAELDAQRAEQEARERRVYDFMCALGPELGIEPEDLVLRRGPDSVPKPDPSLPAEPVSGGEPPSVPARWRPDDEPPLHSDTSTNLWPDEEPLVGPGAPSFEQTQVSSSPAALDAAAAAAEAAEAASGPVRRMRIPRPSIGR